MMTTAWRSAGLGLVLLVACDKKPEAGGRDAPAPSGTGAEVAAAASAAVAGTAQAVGAAVVPAIVTAPTGELSVGAVKSTRGSVTNAENKAKLNLPAMQKQCVTPAVKKDASAVGPGSVKLSVDLDDQGQVLRVKTASEGKVPADVASCLAAYVRKEIKLETNKDSGSVDITLTLTPKG